MPGSNQELHRPFPPHWEDEIIEAYELLDVLERACSWSDANDNGCSRGETVLVQLIQRKLKTVFQEMADYHIPSLPKAS